ncbi:MAG: DNA topoisomerase IV subunit B [Erysipelotrichales bacterium]|nr:DNA topoisomerase IV subunit B [Erysipelotrichales bacterium]
MKKTYNEQSIKVYEGLEAVRKRPGMYIGSTDSRGLHHLVWEIVDNSVDEVLAGFANQIEVTIENDNSVIVEDNGRGMPTGIHETGRPTPEVIFNVLHSGGKFSSENYKVSGGLHGVGSSVVNALSSFLEVTIQRDGKIVSQRFEDGGQKINPQVVLGDSRKTGTKVHFKPNPKCFSTTLLNFDLIKDRLRESAFLIRNLKIILKDQRSNKKEVFLYEQGIVEYLDFLNKEKETLHSPSFFEGSNQNIEVEMAFQYGKTYSETIISFVNNVRTKDGGSHETGLKTALTKVFNEYARKYGILKEKDANLEGVDIREGISIILSVKIPENILQFEGQTKGKLGTPQAKSAVENVLAEKMMFFLEENRALSSMILEKVLVALRAREAARKAKEEARNTNKKNKKEQNLSGKLSPCQSKNKELNELYLVEGDSAGGSAKKGRDRHFQAILPLRGKVINCEKAKVSDVLRNEEIATIIYTIGADFGEDFDIKKCNYNKVIIMTDADTDGAHIQVLLLMFFFRFMPDLIRHGKLYLAMPPLYKISKKTSKKDVSEYAWTEDDFQRLLKEHPNSTIQRFKGLGEMNADQLFDTTMNPKTRNLIRINIDDFNEAEKQMTILMGDNSEIRKEWIENNVSFVTEDNFVIKEAL